ncbi:unnamed protein product, partial [Mesorhabditis belari]|uniref:Uncharacterized protein n=1 Tax=Mesorhabditis belari TaxID=2138241 RepID=A0AAF3FDT7_9BILA
MTKLLHIWLHVFCRTFMFLYEFEWILFTGAANSAPFLLVVSLFRQHCVGVSSLSWFWIVVERHTATHYLIDYESNTRPQIAVILIFTHVVTSFSMAAALLMGAAYDIVITLCIGAPLYAATQIYLTMMLYYLRKYNKRVITEISRDPFKGKRYSLATKYQLNENLRGLEILRRLLLSATLFNSFIGLFITIAYGFFNESSPIAQILFSFLDMLIGLWV